MGPRTVVPDDEPDTLSPADRMRAHAIADRVIEIIEQRHGVSFQAMAEVARIQQAESVRRQKFVQGAALTVLAAIIAAAFSLVGEILRLAIVHLGSK